MKWETESSPTIARIIYDREWDAAVFVSESLSYHKLQPDQLKQVRERASSYIRWMKENPKWHNAISLVSFLFLFAAEFAVLLKVPQFFIPTLSNQIVLGIVLGFIHGFIGYCISNFSLHEGAAHSAIFRGESSLTRGLNFLANNACRIFLSDPVFYQLNHRLHHQKFATRGDGAFSHFVLSRRILTSLLPFAYFNSRFDYKIHNSVSFTRSKLISIFVGILYGGSVFFFSGKSFGWIFATIAILLIGPWVGFSLDRLRESSEHSLLPLDYHQGARNLGYGFWGLLIGGGPWGQPCHLSHHLAPALSWYHQILLHRYLMQTMTPEQKHFFIVEPGVVGYPKFFLSQIRKIREIERRFR